MNGKEKEGFILMIGKLGNVKSSYGKYVHNLLFYGKKDSLIDFFYSMKFKYDSGSFACANSKSALAASKSPSVVYTTPHNIHILAAYHDGNVSNKKVSFS